MSSETYKVYVDEIFEGTLTKKDCLYVKRKLKDNYVMTLDESNQTVIITEKYWVNEFQAHHHTLN